MISQYDIGTIVMLNNLEEGKQVKIMSFFLKHIATLFTQCLQRSVQNMPKQSARAMLDCARNHVIYFKTASYWYGLLLVFVVNFDKLPLFVKRIGKEIII